MDTVMRKQAHPISRKVKKKQVKDELDRIKQAEKKKRRLEKALATSAAIRSELEKKKQMKKEEQQRLDEEGAAIAEAVALHVLLGEDSDDSCQITLNEEKAFNPWDYAANIDMFVDRNSNYLPHRGCANYSVQGIGFVSDAYGLGNNNWPLPYEPFRRNVLEPCFDEAGLIAAQAVSSLQISGNAEVNAIVFNEMLGG